MSFVVGDGIEARESELPALKQLVAMGYEYRAPSELCRERRDLRDALLYGRLEEAIRKHNPELDDDGVRDARVQIEESAYPHNLDIVETNEKIRAKLVGLSVSGGLNPITVTQETSDGTTHKRVKIFDFENPQNNDFLVTNQFRLNGFEHHIIPDIIIFVNGIPLVVMECKSPATPDPILDAVERKNFAKYQQPNQGYERLFFYNHCLVATCGTLARVGTVRATANHFAKWSKPDNQSEADIQQTCGRKPREQEILIAGLLSKHNLLEHLQNFVLYDTRDGKRIKMIAKHQQFRVVTRCVEKASDSSGDKGGVIWHTQGSGKSFSMLWFATQIMYKLGNPPILIVTDRRQLDEQIHDTFKKCGFSDPIKAESGEHLSALLKSPRGKTIMTIIDKFGTPTKSFTNERVICLVDEAHRSQYKMNAAQMRIAMPNAIFFAFTGTPIAKNERRNTYRVFGELLDKYGFKESQDDGSTLPIAYEGRMPQLHVENGDTIDEIFERVFSDLDSSLKETLKKRYVTKSSIAEAPERIKRIVLDLVGHYTQHVEPNRYKAMLVAPSREAAVTYKKMMDAIGGPASKIIMTSEPGEVGKDGENWDKYHLTPEQRNRESERFKNPDDPTKILIVVDMLLVGYDAPICQVLYLDRGIREHTLLQAIARVNRPYDNAKKKGFVMDYSGVMTDMQKALVEFDPKDIEGTLTPLSELLDILRRSHTEAMSLFDGIDITDNDQVLERFNVVHKRNMLEQKFRMFSSALDSVLPRIEAKSYLDDFKAMSVARQVVRTFYGDPDNTLQYATKIQKIIDEHIRSKGISILVDPTEITHENFLVIVNSQSKSKRAQAALIRNRARQVIDELMPKNPTYYEKLYERLQRLICDEEERRKTNAGYFTDPEEYAKIYREALGEEEARKNIFGNYHAVPFEFSLYGKLNEVLDSNVALDLTKEIFEKIKPLTEIVDYKQKSSIERDIQRIVYETLTNQTNRDQINSNQIHDMMSETVTLVRNVL